MSPLLYDLDIILVSLVLPLVMSENESFSERPEEVSIIRFNIVFELNSRSGISSEESMSSESKRSITSFGSGSRGGFME